MKKTYLTETQFSELGLHTLVVKAMDKQGFYSCTPIQSMAIPIAIAGRDVAGQAQTGTGKTLAFLTSTFDYLLNHQPKHEKHPNQPRAVIIAPTRELAVQIHSDAEPLAKETKFKTALA